jgi:hypothetical protein
LTRCFGPDQSKMRGSVMTNASFFDVALHVEVSRVRARRPSEFGRTA